MSNGFEFFEGSATEGTLSPRVTVRKGGQLVLTQAAVDLLGEGTTHVQVGFNPETRAIGIRAADEDTKGRYLLRQQKSSKRLLVDGKRLFALHGIEMEKAHTVDAVAKSFVGWRLRHFRNLYRIRNGSPIFPLCQKTPPTANTVNN